MVREGDGDGRSVMAEARRSATRECYATSLRKASRRLTALYDEALAPVGLRSTQHAILAELTGGPLTINELARLLVLDRSGLGHSLRPLQRDGLVSLERGSVDRRSVEVALTEQGRRRLKEASVHWNSVQEQVKAVLGAPVAGELREQLTEIAENERLS